MNIRFDALTRHDMLIAASATTAANTISRFVYCHSVPRCASSLRQADVLIKNRIGHRAKPGMIGLNKPRRRQRASRPSNAVN